ncbi:hypothetical protein CH063_11217 [Colletotrichum higginsianum]|uniref:Major facilitator superfamily transporter n=1 Tax=Colletotrichum higginsianum (strain IMI 349063) TaxID=759273 RepID=H1VKH7_COLHI|nr:hypothetical protein CH063_11217 [Colletotrichum higginsianum]
MAEKPVDDVQATSDCKENAVGGFKDNEPGQPDFDAAEERAVVKKLDRVILPIMAVVYFFQCKVASAHLWGPMLLFFPCENDKLISHDHHGSDLDKQSINYAAVFGLSEDLRLTGSQFSWCVSLFYFGQLCSEYPAAYLMSRLPIVRFVGVTMSVTHTPVAS